MDSIASFLFQLDQAMAHRWESMSGALEGVSEEEGSWQAPCYATEPPEEGWPLPGTIRWQVAHVAHCERYYTTLVRTRGATSAPAHPVHRATSSLAEDRAELSSAHVELRAAISACRDSELAVVVGTKMPLGEFVAMAIRHVTWHAGQIALARRLFRTRG